MAFTEVSDLLHSMLRIYMSTMLKNVRMNTASIGNDSVFIWSETLILSLALRKKTGSTLQRTTCQRSSLNTVLLFTFAVSCKFFAQSTPPVIHSYRSEERRVGKECRSRWSPYH